MELIADLHSHTLVSSHAFSTLGEMLAQAKKLDLFAMAVTDHGSIMPDAPHPWYFYSLARLPSRVEGVWLLKGIEANVRDLAGNTDFTSEEFSRFEFDWVIASLHSDVLPRKLSFDEATELWLNVAKQPHIDMIGHSESRKCVYDYDAVTKVFAQQHKVVEMNAGSALARPGNEENLRQLALACKKNDVKIAVNSDAHSAYELAQCESVLAMLREISFPRELVMNASRENLICELKLHGKKIAQKMEESI